MLCMKDVWPVAVPTFWPTLRRLCLFWKRIIGGAIGITGGTRGIRGRMGRSGPGPNIGTSGRGPKIGRKGGPDDKTKINNNYKLSFK